MLNTFSLRQTSATFASVLLLLFSNIGLADGTDKCRGETVLFVGDKKVTIEIADTEKKRRYGLMFRSEMGANCGMLFIFKNEGRRVFTMRNTLIPLDIAFIAKDGHIREILTMQPGVDRYPSSVQSHFALELNASWFESNQLSTGTTISVNNKEGEPQALETLLR